MTATNPLDARRSTRMRSHGAARRRRAAAALGHEVDRGRARRGRRRTCCELFISVFGPAVALGDRRSATRLAGREPAEDEIEPLSRAIYERAQAARRRSPTSAPMAQLQALARGLVAFFADYDLLLTPALAERPLPIGECNGLGEDPLARPRRAPASSRPTRRCSTSPASPRSRCRSASARDGLPTGVQIVGKPLDEDVLLQVAAQMEAAHPWAHQRPSM